jgi:hypothetical protein
MAILKFKFWLKKRARRALDTVRYLSPGNQKRLRALKKSRLAAENIVEAWIGSGSKEASASIVQKVLVDGMWDNPNYWIRYALLARALGLRNASTVGVLGPNNRREVAATFERLGVAEIVDFDTTARPNKSHAEVARKIAESIRTPDDCLNLRLPGGFSAKMFYDGVLKRQRRGVIDCADPLLTEYLEELLGCISAAQTILDAHRPNLVVLSHGLNFSYGSLAWEAINRSIPVILLYGDFGTLRFIRIVDHDQLFSFPSRPDETELAALSPQLTKALRDVGRKQIEYRVTGMTSDPGARYAYAGPQKTAFSKADICARHGWEIERPIIGLYGSNFFDYPHCTGMTHFRDFDEWNRTTLAVAAESPHANFIFKPHPIDKLYGMSYGELIDARFQDSPNLRLADEAWRGRDLLDCLDGVVTHHGSIGFEAAAMGKPAMITDTAWYDGFGFVARPESKDAYLSKLSSDWWKDWPVEDARAQAELAAGIYFGLPDWQEEFVLSDDSMQGKIYEGLEAFFDRNVAPMNREAEELRSWYLSGHRYYHMYKVFRAQRFRIGNAIQ